MRTALVNYFVYRLFFKPTLSLTHSCTPGSNVYFRHPAISPFKTQKTRSLAGFLLFLNTGHTKPIVEKILSMFFEKCKHHVDIFGENYLSCHFSQLCFCICFFLPALCNQFINNISIPLVPLIIRQVRYQFLDMMPRQCGW